MKRVQILPERVSEVSLSHQMGEGRGEGLELRNSSCGFFSFGLEASSCLSCAPESFGNSPLGLKNAYGDCCGVAAWPDINSVANIRKGPIIWTSIVWRQNSRSNSTASAMACQNSKNMIRVGTLFSRLAVSWSNVFGITNSGVGKIGRTLKRIFGRYNNPVSDILRTSLCRSIGDSPTDLLRKSPHPDPLPSDGRGNSVYAPIVNSNVRLVHIPDLMEGWRK